MSIVIDGARHSTIPVLSGGLFAEANFTSVPEISGLAAAGQREDAPRRKYGYWRGACKVPGLLPIVGPEGAALVTLR